MQDPAVAMIGTLTASSVQFVVMGVWGINLYARSPATVFTTEDCDLFLPPDAENLLAAWKACERRGLTLLSGREPLDIPRDRWLAERVVERRAVTRVTDGKALLMDMSLTMAGFDFDTVWRERRVFVVDGVEVPVARLTHIVRSKARAGRVKDQMFLASHQDALRELFEVASPPEPDPGS